MATSISSQSKLLKPFAADQSITIERLKRLFSPDLNKAAYLGPLDHLLQVCSGSGESKQGFLNRVHMHLHHSVCFIHRGSFDLPNEHEATCLSQSIDGLSAYSNMEIGLKHKFSWLKSWLKPEIISRIKFFEFPFDGEQVILLDETVLMNQSLEEQLFTARIENKDLFFHIITLAVVHASANLDSFNAELATMNMGPIETADIENPAKRDGATLMALVQFYFSTSTQIQPIKDLLERLKLTESTVSEMSDHFDDAMEAIKSQCHLNDKLSPKTASDRSDIIEQRKQAFMTLVVAYLAYLKESKTHSSHIQAVNSDATIGPQLELQSLAKEALMSLQKQSTTSAQNSFELSTLKQTSQALTQSNNSEMTSINMRSQINTLSARHKAEFGDKKAP